MSSVDEMINKININRLKMKIAGLKGHLFFVQGLLCEGNGNEALSFLKEVTEVIKEEDKKDGGE